MQAQNTRASALQFAVVLLLLGALSAAAAAGSGQARRLLQEDADADHALTAAAAAAVTEQVVELGPGVTVELPEGFDVLKHLHRSANNPGALKAATTAADAGVPPVAKTKPQRVKPTAAKGSRGNPEDRTIAAASTNADDNTTTAASSIGPEAWCTNPASSYAGPEENYQACIILAYRPSGRIPWCSTSFVFSKDSKYNIALTAAHCVSDGKNNFILDTGAHGGINQESIVCCAYDKTKGTVCPSAYSYKIRSIKLYNSYHNGGLVTKDIAVLSVFNSPTGRIPGKWAVDNWDPDSGRRDWWVFGYPQYDDRAGAGATCKKDFFGRRWSWGLSAPVINQPTSTSSSYLYGNACGGLSGAPVLDWRRKALTSVMSLTYPSCDSGGWGRVATAVIRGLPGGSLGLSNTNAGVDVYNLWKDF